MPSDKKKIAKNTLYMYIRMFFQMLVGLYTSRIVLQVLGVSDYGIYNAVGGIVSLFIFLNTAMTQATQRFLSYNLGKGDFETLRKTFSMCLNVHIIIAFTIVVLCEVVGVWLLYNKLVIPPDRLNTAFWVLQFSIFTCVMSVTQVPYNASLYSHEHFNVYAGFQILQIFLNLGFVILLKYVLPGDKLAWYAFNQMLVQFLIMLFNRIYDIRHFKECSYKLFWDKAMFKQVMGYSSWSLVGDVSNTLADQGVNLLLNMFFGPAVNASRGIAVQIKNMVSNFVGNFKGASIPQIVKLYAKDEKDAMNKLVIQSSKISFFMFYVIAIPVIFEIKEITQIWLGQTPDYLVAFSRLQLITVLTQAMGGTLLFVIQATGKIKKYQLSSAIFNLSVFPLSYLFFKLGYNPITPFVLTIIAKILVDCSIYYNVFRLAHFPIGMYLQRALLYMIIVAVLGTVAPFLIFNYMEEGFVRLLVMFAVSMSMSLLLVYYIGFTVSERQWVLNLVKKIIHKV